MNKKIKLMVIGSGMYVSGRGTNGFGTIMPAVFNVFKKNIIEDVIIVSTNNKSSFLAKKKFRKLARYTNQLNKYYFYPKNSKKKDDYLSLAKQFKPDCAIVCVPDNLHAQFCINLAKLKIHCLVVKPMCTNVLEAKKMINIFSKNKLYGAVEFHKRYDEANIAIKELIQNDKLGKLQYASINYSQKKLIPEIIFKKWSNKTNVFNYLGVHYVDLIIFLTNFKPVELIAFGQKDYLSSLKIFTWDSIQVMIKWKRNDSGFFVSSHLTNWIDPNETSSMSDQKISIIGSHGRVDSDQKNRGLQIVSNNGLEELNPYFSSTIKKNIDFEIFGYGIKSVNNYIIDVFNLINKKTNINDLNKNGATFKKSLITVKITEAVTTSLKTGKKIKI